MEHTPGEWEADGLRVWAYSPSGEPIYIASLKFANDTEVGGAEATANTHLIKAAPALLKACEAYLKAMACVIPISVEEICDTLNGITNQMMAVVDKAKGA